jgi:hypothetical protein
MLGCVLEGALTDRPRTPILGRRLVGTVLIAGLLVGCASGVMSIGFGTGGSECTLTGESSSFPVGVPIRDVLTMSPALAAGGTVEIKVEKDGTELVDHHETFTAEEPTDCIQGSLSGLEVGHYRIEYSIDPSDVPPIVGEFEVTP